MNFKKLTYFKTKNRKIKIVQYKCLQINLKTTIKCKNVNEQHYLMMLYLLFDYFVNE